MASPARVLCHAFRGVADSSCPGMLPVREAAVMNDHSRNRERDRAWLFGDDQAAPPAASQPESLQAMLEQTADEAGEPYHGLLDRMKNSTPQSPQDIELGVAEKSSQGVR